MAEQEKTVRKFSATISRERSLLKSINFYLRESEDFSLRLFQGKGILSKERASAGKISVGMYSRRRTDK